MSPVVFAASNLEELPAQSAIPAAASISQLQLLHTTNLDTIQKPVNGAFPSEADDTVARGFVTGSRKRSKVNVVGGSLMHRRQAVPDSSYNYRNLSAISPKLSVCLSTGLQLTFQDEHFERPLAPCNTWKSNSVSILSQLNEDLKPQLLQQREEIDEFIKNQEEQVKRNLEEKRRRHSREITTVIENRFSRTLREKEIEVERVLSKNVELEEKVKNVFQQACAWQSRAKFNEAMMFALRNNLHQAVSMSREQSKEGCGDDHQANDAESSCPDDTADAHAMAFRENKQLKEQRSCKACRSNDVSVLLLPCRHLCLCKECEASMDSCPLCRSFKTASVQVYLT